MLAMLAEMSFYNIFFGTIVGCFIMYAAGALAGQEGAPTADKASVATTPVPAQTEQPASSPRATGSAVSASSGSGSAALAVATDDDEAPLLGANIRAVLDMALIAVAVLSALSIIAYEVRDDPFLDILKRMPAESSIIGRALRQLRHSLGLF